MSDESKGCGMRRMSMSDLGLRELYTSDADLLPDHKAGTLTVRIHHMANRCSDTAIGKLCEELNATKTTFPGTDLCLIFKLGSN